MELRFSNYGVLTLIALNVLNGAIILYTFLRADHTQHVLSYKGGDFPEHPPISRSASVRRVFNASDHIPLLGLQSDGEWTSLMSEGMGYAQLGPESRIFGIVMFHELHCLRVLNLAFGRHPASTAAHVQHCLGYLRSLAICRADATLEPGDFMSPGWGSDTTVEHTCVDTSAIYQWMDANFKHWVTFNTSNYTS